MLTDSRGEFILRLGSKPQNQKLFSGDASETNDWIGSARTEEDLQKRTSTVARLVEDIGGKVGNTTFIMKITA